MSLYALCVCVCVCVVVCMFVCVCMYVCVCVQASKRLYSEEQIVPLCPFRLKGSDSDGPQERWLCALLQKGRGPAFWRSVKVSLEVSL